MRRQRNSGEREFRIYVLLVVVAVVVAATNSYSSNPIEMSQAFQCSCLPPYLSLFLSLNIAHLNMIEHSLQNIKSHTYSNSAFQLLR